MGIYSAVSCFASSVWEESIVKPVIRLVQDVSGLLRPIGGQPVVPKKVKEIFFRGAVQLPFHIAGCAVSSLLNLQNCRVTKKAMPKDLEGLPEHVQNQIQKVDPSVRCVMIEAYKIKAKYKNTHYTFIHGQAHDWSFLNDLILQ